MNPEVKRRIDNLVRQIEKRPQTEKLIVLLALILAMGMGYLTYVADPLTAARTGAASSIATVTRQIQGQQAAYAQKVAQSQEDPNRFANERLAAIRSEQSAINREIDSIAGELVTPGNMTRLLTAALEGQDRLELQQIENSGAQPLRTGISGSATASESASDSTDDTERALRNISGQVYQHGIVLQFRGEFFSTLAYLQLLERLSSSFYWDSLTFTQNDWPGATIRLQLHTLSTQEGFLGA